MTDTAKSAREIIDASDTAEDVIAKVISAADCRGVWYTPRMEAKDTIAAIHASGFQIVATPAVRVVSEEQRTTELVKIGLQALKTLNATPTQIPGWRYTEETQMQAIIVAIRVPLIQQGLREAADEAEACDEGGAIYDGAGGQIDYIEPQPHYRDGAALAKVLRARADAMEKGEA